MLFYGVFYFFNNFLYRFVIVVNNQRLFDNKRLQYIFLFHPQSFFIKRTSETVNHDWNYNRLVLFDDVRRSFADRLKRLGCSLRKSNYPAIFKRDTDIFRVVWIDFTFFFHILSSGTPSSFYCNCSNIRQYPWQQSSFHGFTCGYIIDIEFRLPQITDVFYIVISSGKARVKYVKHCYYICKIGLMIGNEKYILIRQSRYNFGTVNLQFVKTSVTSMGNSSKNAN